MLGDTVEVALHLGGAFPRVPVVVTSPGVQLPNAGPILAPRGSISRYDIDLDAVTLRIDFDTMADYPPDSAFYFLDINPIVCDSVAAIITNTTATAQSSDPLYNVNGKVTFSNDFVRVQYGNGVSLTQRPDAVPQRSAAGRSSVSSGIETFAS